MMMKNTIPAQDQDDEGLNQVAEVLDHARDLLFVVVGRWLRLSGTFASFLPVLKYRRTSGKTGGRAPEQRSAPCPA